MTRIQYTRGLQGDFTYAARSRRGLGHYGNPFAVDRVRLKQYHPFAHAWHPLLVPAGEPPLDPVELFATLLQDPHALPKWDILPSVREHMRLMATKIPRLRPDATLACWCPLDADCHVDEIIRFRQNPLNSDRHAH